MSAQRLAYASNLTDEEWQILEPLLAPEKPGGRLRKYRMREVQTSIDLEVKEILPPVGGLRRGLRVGVS